MPKLRCVIAESRKELDDALRVRWQVFVDECRYLRRQDYFTRREFDAFDTLESTFHFVAYLDDRPCATVRLLMPNVEVAAENGSRFGLDMERKYDLADFARQDVSVAETPRSSVIAAARSSGALMVLYGEMYRVSRMLGVTHWVASANTETDVPEDAALVYELARKKGFVSDRYRVSALKEESAPTGGSHRIPVDAVKGPRFPRTLSIFATRMGARYTGRPVYDGGFRMFAIPLVCDLAALPYETRAEFEGTEAGLAAAV